MLLNGKEITKQEELEMYKVQLVELKLKYKEFQEKQESIHNEIVFTSGMIKLIETKLKYKELKEKQMNVRSQFEFDKIQKQLDKIENNI